ncbi:MerR family transcriptional regulator [Micromonospora endophytica]|uniref:MerR family transcriptional regulator n=1 Tax=Micromonospora endophytica TaxID=515350 RepID=A0A2W2D230_9ACTN|nr:MerR family transcriptional regulator [Micromonospora endophytica]PZF86573.1 MerR family transcriptional regulator [Micromonospora endophytica]RIW47099.1 MerR family transcriptional regulator [Micromonospora endophytica]
MRSIGELARASGLTVSSLRFYDAAGVLVPARVDSVTGYRRYTDDQVAPARLVAGLRRIGMPVPEIAQAVHAEPAVVHRLLDTHLRRLEDGLADARREASRIRELLSDHPASAANWLVLAGRDLAAAVDAVRFAVGTDPELPALSGVLLEVAEDGVRLVATDRYRLAVAWADAAVHGSTVRTLLPVAAVDELRRLLAGVDDDARVWLTVAGTQVVADVAGHRLPITALPHDFPDYAPLLPPGGASRRVSVDADWLVAALRAGEPTFTREYAGRQVPVTVLGLRGPDAVRLLAPGDQLEEPLGEPLGKHLGEPLGADLTELHVGVNGDYLLDALDAAGRPHLVLELDGPTAPLAIRRPDDEIAFSLLMPIRL